MQFIGTVLGSLIIFILLLALLMWILSNPFLVIATAAILGTGATVYYFGKIREDEELY